MQYIIYCDESEKHGKYYGNFYGGAVISSNITNKVITNLNDKKHSLGFQNEVKWSRVTANYLSKYIELIDLFFDYIADNTIKVRIMFTQKMYVPKDLSKEQKENEFFILYYYFFKYAFGLQYCNQADRQPTSLRIYFDNLPDTKEKAERFN